MPGAGAGTAMVAAMLLGLRHATDPDHLAAVSTLVLDPRAGGLRRARTLGAAWGFGHAVTLFLFGLPIVLFQQHLPAVVRQVAEAAIGAVIVALALRLLVRWYRGYFHLHPHVHDGQMHAHPHMHEHPRHAPHPERHGHRHAEGLGRSPVAAFGIGLIHGIGGSAAAGVLLAGAAPTPSAAIVALLLFALGTAVSMLLVTSFFGALLAHPAVSGRLAWMIPTLGVISLGFGVWYGLGAVAL